MLTEVIHPLAHYNLWANEQLTLRLQTLTEEQMHQEIISSFRSILKTIAHIHATEDVWRQRLHKVALAVFYKLPENASGVVEITKWLDASRELTNVMLSYDEEQLRETINYFDSHGVAHGNFRWQMIQHAVNHSSYHRGQIVTMLRQVGVTLIPSTDLIAYYRTLNEVVK